MSTTDKITPKVLVGTGAAEPTSADESDEWRCIRIVRTLGTEPDYAILERDLGTPGTRIGNVSISAGMNRKVGIRADIVFSDSGTETVSLFSGEMARGRPIINVQKETEQVEVTLEAYRFGNVIEGYDAWNVFASATTAEQIIRVDEDIMFNPRIDGQIRGNMSDYPTGVTDNKPEAKDGSYYRIWLSPYQIRTTNASIIQQEVGERIGTVNDWTAKEAIRTLWEAHRSPTDYIEFPDNTELDNFFNPLNLPTDRLNNIIFPRGMYSIEAIGQLLRRLDLDFYVEHTIDSGTDTDKRKIVLVQRGTGTEKEVALPIPTEELDISKAAKNLTNDILLDVDVASIANRVIVQGAVIEREISVELFRAWSETDDNLAATDLQKSDTASQYSSKRNVWRLWVANEAGDWKDSTTPLRPTIQTIPDEPLDLSDVFPDGYVPRRRVFEECLTWQTDAVTGNRRRRPVFVEYYDNAAAAWKPVPPEWGYIVRQDQMGIEFTGDWPPEDLLAQEDTGSSEFARIRVTGTIAGDQRIKHTTSRLTESPNTFDVALFVKAEDRFFNRQRQATGDFSSKLLTEPDADTRDDSTEIESFADDIRGEDAGALITGKITIPRITNTVKLGDVITKVAGREISLNRFIEGEGNQVGYPQVTSIAMDTIKNTTELQLEVYEAEQPA